MLSIFGRPEGTDNTMRERIMKRSFNFGSVILCCALMAATGTAVGEDDSEGKGNNSCAGLPSYTGLKNALTTAVAAETSGRRVATTFCIS